LHNSQSDAAQGINAVLKDIIGTECYVLLDDVILYSKTPEEHAQRFEHLLQRLDKANLQLYPGKCVIAQPQLKYLCYVLSENGVSASADKVKAIENYLTPKKTLRHQSVFRPGLVLQAPGD
jgi:hypothetical protein